jgi:hypothetical protein
VGCLCMVVIVFVQFSSTVNKENEFDMSVVVSFCT